MTLSDAVFTADGVTTLTINSSTASSGALTVSASGLTAVNSLDVNVSSSGHGAADSIVLGAGNDTVRVDNDSLATANSQTITGGSGTDTLSVKTGTATTVTLGAGLTGFDVITAVAATENYDFTADSANVASGASLTVDGSALTSGTLRWIGTAETNGTFVLTGGNVADTLVGGSLNDTISGGSGADSISGGSGIDNLSGGTGDDIFTVGAAGVGFVSLTAAETVSGGSGNDTLQFLTETTVSVAATDLGAISGIETLTFVQTTANPGVT